MSAKPYVWALGLMWGLPAVAVTVGYLLLDKDVPPSECSSAMFGCMSDADAVLFFGQMGFFYVLIPAGVAVVAIIALVQLLPGRRRDHQTAADATPPGRWQLKGDRRSHTSQFAGRSTHRPVCPLSKTEAPNAT